MQFDLRQAIDSLEQGTVFQIANAARPGSNYLFNTILPEEKHLSYQAKSGNMTIRATMAGLVSMDSPYPEGGAVEISEFSEDTAKIANRVRLPEQLLRQLQELIFRLQATGGNSVEAIQRTALNFVNKLIVQPHLDTMEWLRGQALVMGRIDWTFNKKRLLVDYGIPAANFLPQRTGASGYGGASSVFWSDIRKLRQLLGGGPVRFIMHSETKNMILANDANNIKLLAEDLDAGTFSIVRYKVVGGTTVESTDPRDRASFITYDDEGEIWDLLNPGKTKKIVFMPRGAILALGTYKANRFVIGAGSTAPPSPVQLGYTHLAPSVEGGGTPGRWTDVGTPWREPWAMEGRGVTNGLPVLEANDRTAVASTEMV